MPSITSLAPAAPALPSPPPVPPVTATPLAGGTTLPADLVTVGSTGIAETQASVASTVQLALATPQELQALADSGNQQAAHILEEAAASRRLLSPVDLTA